MIAQHDWNVVVTIHEEGFKPTKRALREAGTIWPTDYHDVLVMKVEDPEAFTDLLAARVAREPGLLNFMSRVVPTARVFDFHDAEEFETKARDVLAGLRPELAGRSFHVRMDGRGSNASSRRRTRSGPRRRAVRGAQGGRHARDRQVRRSGCGRGDRDRR